MSIELISLLMFGSMLLLILSGLPIAFALGGLSVIFVSLLWGPEAIELILYATMDVQNMYTIVCVPGFVFTGVILQNSGIADDMFDTIRKWSGRLKGGLAIGVVIICALFGAMVGIAAVGTLTMGLIALPAMLKRNYDKELAMGTIQAGGALGCLIPPSVVFALYGVIARQSIGQLFMAGLFPGLMLAGLFIIYIVIRCHFQPHLGPGLPPEERVSWNEKFVSLKGLIFPFLLIFLVLGLIMLGVTTPTEASAVGAIGSIIVAIIRRKLNWPMLKNALLSTMKLTAMVAWIFIAALSFSRIYTGLGAVELLAGWLEGIGLGPWGTIIMMQVSFFLMGFVLDEQAMLFIVAPIYIPIVAGLGFDLVWFGVLYVMNTEMALLTPPYGFNLFYMKSIVPKGITMMDIYKSVIPYVGLQALGLAMVMIFPQIAMWLPDLVKAGLAQG